MNTGLVCRGDALAVVSEAGQPAAYADWKCCNSHYSEPVYPREPRLVTCAACGRVFEVAAMVVVQVRERQA